MKKQQILIAASKLFMELGYGAVSMEQVAREANVSKATLYAHFKSKNDLFVAMLNHYQQVEQIKFPQLPEAIAAKLNELHAVMLSYIQMAYDYYAAESVVRLYRLLMSEIQQFPELFELFFGRNSAGLTNSLAKYLQSYAEKQASSESCFSLACQILDLVRGASIWTKLVQNPAKQYLIEQPELAVRQLQHSCQLLVDDHFSSLNLKVTKF